MGIDPLGLTKTSKAIPIFLATFLLIIASSLPAQELDSDFGPDYEDSAAPAPFVPEFSRYLPVWTQVYTEVRGLGAQLDRLGWLSRLTEHTSETSPAVSRPAVPPPAEQFDRVIRFSLGISLKEFLNDLLGEHFALGWGGPFLRDEFGLICRVKVFAFLGWLLTASKAEPLSLPGSESSPQDRVKLYRLGYPNLLAAVIDKRELILATSGTPDKASMFYSMVDLARERSDRNLRQNPHFMTAAQSASPDYRFLFILLTSGQFDAGKPHLGKSLFDELQKSVDFISITDVPRSKSPAVKVFIQPKFVDPVFLPDRPLQLDPFMRNMICTQTDLAYASVISTDRWYRRIVELAEQGFLDARQYRAMIDLVLPDRKVRDRLIESLGSEVLLIVSSETAEVPATAPATRAASRPASRPSSKPGLALVVRTDDPALTVGGVGQMFNILAGFLTIQNLASGSTDSAGRLSRETYHGVELNHLDIGRILPSNRSKSSPEWNMELTWTMVDQYLIVTTSTDMAHRLIDRAFGPKITTISVGPTIAEGTALPGPTNWALSFRPSAMARHTKVFCEMLDELWPAIQSPFGSTMVGKNPFRVVLGIGSRVVKMPNEDRAVVQVAAVLPGYPAWDKLRIGDVILDVDGSPLDSASPQKDLHRKVDGAINRGDNVKMRVLRAGQPRDVEIAISRFNGVISPRGLKMLHRLLDTIGGRFDQVDIACNYAPDGQIRVQFNFQPRAAATTTRPAK